MPKTGESIYKNAVRRGLDVVEVYLCEVLEPVLLARHPEGIPDGFYNRDGDSLELVSLLNFLIEIQKPPERHFRSKSMRRYAGDVKQSRHNVHHSGLISREKAEEELIAMARLLQEIGRPDGASEVTVLRDALSVSVTSEFSMQASPPKVAAPLAEAVQTDTGCRGAEAVRTLTLTDGLDRPKSPSTTEKDPLKAAPPKGSGEASTSGPPPRRARSKPKLASPDARASQAWTQVNGWSIPPEAWTNGSAVQIDNYADGTVITTVTRPDGTILQAETLPDGRTFQVERLPDGSYAQGVPAHHQGSTGYDTVPVQSASILPERAQADAQSVLVARYRNLSSVHGPVSAAAGFAYQMRRDALSIHTRRIAEAVARGERHDDRGDLATCSLVVFLGPDPSFVHAAPEKSYAGVHLKQSGTEDATGYELQLIEFAIVINRLDLAWHLARHWYFYKMGLAQSSVDALAEWHRGENPPKRLGILGGLGGRRDPSLLDLYAMRDRAELACTVTIKRLYEEEPFKPLSHALANVAANLAGKIDMSVWKQSIYNAFP